MEFKKVGKKALSLLLAFIMAVPMIVFVPSFSEEALAATGWGLWTSGRESVTMNGITAEVVAWNPGGTGGALVTRAGYTAASVAALPATVNNVGAREMLVRVSGTMYRYVTGTINPDLPAYGRPVTRVTTELPIGSNVLVYARAHNGGLHVGTTGQTGDAGTMRQVRDRGPMTSIANLGRNGRSVTTAHDAAAWNGFGGTEVAPRSVVFGGNTYVVIGFPDTFTQPAHAAGANSWARNTHFPAVAGNNWGFADVLENGQVRLYMGIVSDNPNSGGTGSGAGAALTMTVAGTAAGVNIEAMANNATIPGFMVSGGAGLFGFRNNIMSVNGLAVRAAHRRLTPASATVSYRLEGVATQAGNYTMWFSTNGAMYGNGRQARATGDSFPSGGQNGIILSGPFGQQDPPRNTYAIAVGDLVNRSTTWEVNMSQPAATVLRIEYAPFPALGEVITRNVGVNMSATGSLNAPAYTVRAALRGTAGVAGNHRVTLSGIPATYYVSGQTVLTNTTTATAERVALTGADARRIEWIVPVGAGAVTRDGVFNIQRPGFVVNQARADVITGGLDLHHEFFPNVTLANSTLNGVTAGGTASFSPDTGQITVTVPFSGTATQAGRYNVTLSSTNTAVNAELAGDVRSFQQSAGAVTRAPMTWFIETGATVDVASLGLAVTVTADIEAPPVSIGSANNNGVNAAGTARVLPDVVQISTHVTGTPTVTGAYRVRVLYNGTEIDSRTYRVTAGDGWIANSGAGRTFMTSFDPPATFDVSGLSLNIAFIPVLTAGPVQGVSAIGNITVFDDDGVVSVTLSGTVQQEGFYRVTLTGNGFTMADNAPNFQMERFSRNATAQGTMGFDILISDMSAFVSSATITLARFDGDIFFYAINYVDESIDFGNNFTVYQVPAFTEPDPRGRRTLIMDANNMPTYEFLENPITGVLRGDLSFSFNRRADRIDPTRGNWGNSTLTGRVDLQRHLRRPTFMGVRRQLPNNSFELIAIIPLGGRPVNRAIRAHRRDIYVAPMLGADNIVSTAGHFQNPEPLVDGATLEVRIANDRRNPNAGFLATERLAPGETHEMPHDRVPRGSRGTYRIAPTDVDNFVMYGGEMVAVRDILARYAREDYIRDDGNTIVPNCDAGEPIVLGEGNFGSALVRFRIPNAPLPPAVARMTMTPGRNGAPFFISGTNANMFVNVGTRAVYDDGGNYTGTVTHWERLDRSIPLAAFLGLFVARDTDVANNITRFLPASHNVMIGGNSTAVRDFEIRVLRAGRVQSAPGFLRLEVDAANANLNPSARIVPVLVTGEQNDQSVRSPLYRTGTRVVIHTSNGLVDNPRPARGDVVGGATAPADNNWFPNLPEGLTATITAMGAGNSQITVTIQGRATEASSEAIQIVIPEGRLVADAPFVVPNVPVPVGDPPVYLAPARFNITGDSRPVVQSITPPDAIDITFEAASTATTAANWTLPANVTLVTDDGGTADTAQAVVDWDLDTILFVAGNGAQTLTAVGSVTAFPGTVAPGSISLPATVSVTINVAAPTP